MTRSIDPFHLPVRAPAGPSPAAPAAMRLTLPLTVLLGVLGLAGCLRQPEGPGPAGLAYDVPDPNPATYTFTDSATFALQAPGYGVMEVETARDGTAELHFRPSQEGYHVRVGFPELRSVFRSPAQGTSQSDESDIDGPVGVDLSFTGAAVVVDTPGLSPALLEVTSAEGLVRPLFVRLPARPVGPGAHWTDTTRTVEERVGTVSRGTSITTSTVLGDTVVSGQRLLRIRTTAITSVEIDGVSGGVEVEQRMTGIIHGRVLWDEGASLLVERVEAGELTGTLGMPGTGVTAMPISATVRRRVGLRP